MTGFILSAATSLLIGSPTDLLESNARGIEVLEESYEAHGGDRAVAAASRMAIEMSGTLDRGARRQGMTPGSSDAGPYEEWIVIDEANDRLGFQQYHERYDGAIEWWRFVYSGEDRMRFTSPTEGVAVDVPEPAAATRRQRLPRILPAVLLSDLLSERASVVYRGREEGLERVTGLLDGALVEVALDVESGLVRRVTQLVDEPLIGDTEVHWIYREHGLLEGFGPMFRELEIELAGRTVKSVRVDRVLFDDIDEHGVFSIPEGLGEPRVIPTPPASAENGGPRPPRVIERAPWVWQVAGIRGGFNVAFFELEEFVVVFEAPAGWIELHEIPASNFERGASSSSVGEALLDVVREHVPDKPVRYLVLSHFHGDHSGGLRPFVAAGATIVTTSELEELYTESVRRPFRLEDADPVGVPEFLFVDGAVSLSDGERVIEIVEIEDNPHAEGLLSIWLPEERMLFVADLFAAARLETFPRKSEVAVQKAFVEWLDRKGYEPVAIYGVHGGAGTPEHLEKLRAAGDER